MANLHPLPHTRVPTFLFPSPAAASQHVAREIETAVRANNARGKATVLGLATGSTPVGLYRELIRRHKEEGLDLSRVVTFNLDEYYPIPRDDPHSYFRWMHETFFHHVNIKPENVHIPDGTLKPEEVDDFCAEYERKIKAAGGIDIQVLGIGRTGHIGFNEPGSPRNSRTRMVTLDSITRRDAASGFFGEENVPNQAVTMGVASILDAKRVFLMAYGEHKAPSVCRAVEQPPSEAVSASFLQEHENAAVLLDEAAAAELTAVKRPWEVGPCEWTADTVRRAVVHLALSVKKGLQKLNDDDFREHRLYDLLRERGPAERIGEEVFHDRLATIRMYPAGKSRQGDRETRRHGDKATTAESSVSLSPCLPVSLSGELSGETGKDEAKTILVFSPHPDDDVISMGGTLIRLVEQGHRVHIAYMTSGNIAVFDHDARRFIDFIDEFSRAFGLDPKQVGPLQRRMMESLETKTRGQPDSAEVLRVKQLIRATEARAAARACGIMPNQLEFLDLRFYRTGTATKDPIHPKDIEDVVALMERLRPAQVYVAGELSDPHGTHRMCAEAVFAATRIVREKAGVRGKGTGVRSTKAGVSGEGLGVSADQANSSLTPDPSPLTPFHFDVWLYKGAWEEWEPHEVEMAVPLSPEVLERKKQAIFRHQSQKDKAMFPGGTDRREFWQRAEDRNLATAKTYDALGLPEYYALEAFVRWKDRD